MYKIDYAYEGRRSLQPWFHQTAKYLQNTEKYKLDIFENNKKNMKKHMASHEMWHANCIASNK